MKYPKLIEMLKDGSSEDDIYSFIKAEENAIKSAVDGVDNKNTYTVKGGLLYKNDEACHNWASTRIIDIVKEGLDPSPVLRFMERADSNPGMKDIANDIYKWLDRWSMPITEDGHFLAYKKVNSDFTSIYDNRTKNDVGTIVSMDRDECNSDRNELCSKGLHFCAHSYLSSFGSSYSKVIILKIDPADVVSFPTDYNMAKGRACKYEVVGVHESGDDSLKGTSVAKVESKPATISKQENSVAGSDFVKEVSNRGGRKTFAKSKGWTLKKFAKHVKDTYGMDFASLKKLHS